MELDPIWVTKLDVGKHLLCAKKWRTRLAEYSLGWLVCLSLFTSIDSISFETFQSIEISNWHHAPGRSILYCEWLVSDSMFNHTHLHRNSNWNPTMQKLYFLQFTGTRSCSISTISSRPHIFHSVPLWCRFHASWFWNYLPCGFCIDWAQNIHGNVSNTIRILPLWLCFMSSLFGRNYRMDRILHGGEWKLGFLVLCGLDLLQFDSQGFGTTWMVPCYFFRRIQKVGANSDRSLHLMTIMSLGYRIATKIE